jgi:hypothetical protein
MAMHGWSMSCVVEGCTTRPAQLVKSDDVLCLPIHCTKIVAAEIDMATVTSLCNFCDVGLEHFAEVLL